MPLFSEADPENLDRGGQTYWGALSGASRGYIPFNFWLVGLRALYQLGHLPTSGGAMAPLAPPPVYPPLVLHLLKMLVVNRQEGVSE